MGGQHPRSHIIAPANAGKKSNGQGHVEDEFCSCWCKETSSPMPISQVSHCSVYKASTGNYQKMQIIFMYKSSHALLHDLRSGINLR